MKLAQVDNLLIFKRSSQSNINGRNNNVIGSTCCCTNNPSTTCQILSGSLRIRNLCENHGILFKIKCTTVERFKVVHSLGVIPADSYVAISVILKDSKISPSQLESERFQVQVLPVPYPQDQEEQDSLTAAAASDLVDISGTTTTTTTLTLEQIKSHWDQVVKKVTIEKHNVKCSFFQNNSEQEGRWENGCKWILRNTKGANISEADSSEEEHEDEGTDGDDDDDDDGQLLATAAASSCLNEAESEWKIIAQLVKRTELFCWGCAILGAGFIIILLITNFLGFIQPKTDYILQILHDEPEELPVVKEEMNLSFWDKALVMWEESRGWFWEQVNLAKQYIDQLNNNYNNKR